MDRMINAIIKSKKPLLAVLHDCNLDDGQWFKIEAKRIGIKGVRLINVYTTGTGEKPDVSQYGWDTYTHKYIVSRDTICLVCVDIP